MEQTSLLQAIVDNPQEDTPRLMYADWLDEHMQDDQSKATSEFIRASCLMGKTSFVMPRPAYRWLDTNWQRLIPRTLALHVPFEPHQRIPIHGHAAMVAGENAHCDTVLFHVSGRRVWFRINLQGKRYPNTRPGVTNRAIIPKERVYSCSVHLEFWKGFVRSFSMWSSWGSAIIAPVLYEEQQILNLTPTPGTEPTE